MLWGIHSHLVSLVFLGLMSFIFICLSLVSLNSGLSHVIEWDIISLHSSSIVVTLVYDWISTLFLGAVLFISCMVMYYSGDYMHGDKSYNRFMYLVLAFVLSMGALIISPNLISILLGWDGLGLISYVLVIYYQNEKSANAGMLTVLSNRVGDVGILLSISLLFALGGWNFIFSSEYLGDNFLLLKVLVCVAAMTKSAQIPFSAWLPAAMAAPTPVSALVHSSTLVTAGVYILIRFSGSLEGSFIQAFLLIVSCLTMFMAGLGANFEFDLKKIIALSTLSQLGVMMSILSLGFIDLAFFHLLTHALFKALLFMCAGMVIHSVKEYQDIRNMGSLVVCMPFTSVCMNLANLALCGMPFLAGFYSKDLILEVAFMSEINFLSFILYSLATGLTVCYTFRLVFYSLSSMCNMSSMMFVSEDYSMMMSGIMALSIGAVIGGSSLAWIVFPESYMICLSVLFKVLALLVSGVGALIGYIVNMVSVSYNPKVLESYSYVVFMGSMWFMPILSTLSLSRLSLNWGGSFFKVGDKGWSEYFGGEGSFFSLVFSSGYLQFSQENMVMTYMKSFLVWIIIVFFIFM
uniref:NADH-ubiquinone oxidoreductase chain 5 n=1 Tax=Cherax cainii TaxID=223846 RepID=V5LX33_9EUCA|nr:NADH dehydrogenase subunit 5 [Cherax cainii]AHA59373.1 NADH dehydrogenase subunit 5 [Cherax cainii]CDN96585.1 NADH dehydrogenase subunit 5 [Cherax cainii]